MKNKPRKRLFEYSVDPVVNDEYKRRIKKVLIMGLVLVCSMLVAAGGIALLVFGSEGENYAMRVSGAVLLGVALVVAAVPIIWLWFKFG